ncbi:hypothetical protein EV589_5966 [Mycobacterium sp. BK558]|jgi:hypothetical protein|nr:hypothetical protein [Mycobacterium sp.]RZT07735.1 hypothetical protein EV589_5966 [Mycobacterium sp. BK558]
MSDGIASLRNRKAERAGRQAPPPRHPKPAPVDAGAGPADDTPAGSSTSVVDVAAPPSADAVAETPAPPAASVPPAPAAARTEVASDASSSAANRALPELEIDWTDPLMHVASPTRVSVANSVAARFKAAAEQPGSAPQTELIMEAVSSHLADLPELVLGRRPEENATQPSGFFLRRAPVQKAEPVVPVYMRPIAGEVEALRRIVDWVNSIILEGHPGRPKSTRSEIVTAALDASYPSTRSR